jgi:hypothetical protein
MRSTKMRNLLVVNEQFLDEHNADIGHYGQTLINPGKKIHAVAIFAVLHLNRYI